MHHSRGLSMKRKLFCAMRVNFCRFRDLPVEGYKLFKFFATFAVSRGLSMRGEKIYKLFFKKADQSR